MVDIMAILRDTMPMDMLQHLRILTCITLIMLLDMEITSKHSSDFLMLAVKSRTSAVGVELHEIFSR